ncbi:MAG: hypothetical protein AABY22_16220 [Nanoarchaeota archaeon]
MNFLDYDKIKVKEMIPLMVYKSTFPVSFKQINLILIKEQLKFFGVSFEDVENFKYTFFSSIHKIIDDKSNSCYNIRFMILPFRETDEIDKDNFGKLTMQNFVFIDPKQAFSMFSFPSQIFDINEIDILQFEGKVINETKEYGRILNEWKNNVI